MVSSVQLTTAGLILDAIGAILLIVPLLTTQKRETGRALQVLDREKELRRLMDEESLSFQEANMRASGKVRRKVRDARIGAGGGVLLAIGYVLQLVAIWS